MQKINLKGLTRQELEEWVLNLGEKRFRANQLFAWIYRKNVTDFAQMTDISQKLRDRLAEIAFIGELKVRHQQHSPQSATYKFLFELPDGLQVESVLMEDDSRMTACLSSQVGCALGCQFCATGGLGFSRNLEAWEIIEQFQAMQRQTGINITNVVMMGMGEPFLNYENVLKACHLLNDADGPAIGHRKIVISTAGIVPKIIQFANEKQPFKLAISLNAPNDQLRSDLMPINKKYPLTALIEAAKYYAQHSRLRITFEYVLFHNINDREQDAIQLKQCLQGVPCKINLIPYNEVKFTGKRPSTEQVEQFFSYFKNYAAVVSIRWSKGTDIDAACGQLAARKK